MPPAPDPTSVLVYQTRSGLAISPVDRRVEATVFHEIPAYEAKTKLPELLRQVRGGQRFTITDHGEPIADLVPSAAGLRADYSKAIEEMANFEGVTGVDPDEVLVWIREGRS